MTDGEAIERIRHYLVCLSPDALPYTALELPRNLRSANTRRQTQSHGEKSSRLTHWAHFKLKTFAGRADDGQIQG
jgi:hypothetical protein